ncbi:type III secretion system translocator chaperone SicA [Tatumella ptyseos]|uniref:type III secretion system translocator chaperone SicA n=1 Tax=Tatumella ptyseos TaxID=82987 RepID=UPI0026F00C81|nr:type III secretion system translocator chaperone SicA [Tatumella ptyseos]WKX25750.1 type III secretion system translocator chaperone SicA [Tatumella ptyseos]
MENKIPANFLHCEELNESDEEIERYSNSLIEVIQNGATLKDVQGVSNDTMQDIYTLAYEAYQRGNLDDAESLFRFLCIYDFYNSEYPMGLAAVLQLKKSYSKAIDFYALAYSLSKEDYRPMLYAGQCNLMLRQVIQAKRCFEIVNERCSDQRLRHKATAYLSALSKLANNDIQDPE